MIVSIKALVMIAVTNESLARARGGDPMSRVLALRELNAFDQLHPGFRKKIRTMTSLLRFDHPALLVDHDGLKIAKLGKQTFIGFTKEEREMVDALKFFQLV